MNIIIFSLNRPAQLELLIRSMKFYFKEFSNFKIKILFKYTEPNFEKGYNKLFKLHPDENIIWSKENNFKNDLISLIDKQEKYTVFFVDDIVFKEPFSIEDEKFKYFDLHGDILCLSLRLHKKLTYCYPARVSMKSPDFNENNVFLWNNQSGDYGYPMSLDGHIFRTKDIFFYLIMLNYDGPNPLEAQMSFKPLPYPKMMCYDKSIILNNPLNKVQKWNNNVHGKVTAEEINKEFLEGKIIDLDTFKGYENISCHQEIPIKFI